MQNKLDYVLKNFYAIYHLNPAQYEIGYGLKSTGKVKVMENHNDFFNRIQELDFESIVWSEWKGSKIPFLFGGVAELAQIITREKDSVIINADIIASSFYFLSNWQEYTCKNKDHYGRFPYAESIQFKLGIIDKPIVNYYFDILKTALEIAYNKPIINPDWVGKPFAVCLTHDIDECESAWKQGSYRELIRGNVFSPFKLISKKVFANDDWFNFQTILDIEKRYDANSSFYFLPRQCVQNGIKNADYNIRHPKFKKVFETIRAHGSEVGLHGSVGTHDNTDALRADKSQIGFPVSGGRFHFLLYDAVQSPEVLQKANFIYDSSLGFAEHYGFRNSICHPFTLFDIKNDQSANVLEIPLVMMDRTLSSYLKSGKVDAVEKTATLIAEIEKFGGCFTLLWHNQYFSDYKYSGWREVFEKILQLCKEKNGWLSSGQNIANYFERPVPEKK
jgi:hypothetical protein